MIDKIRNLFVKKSIFSFTKSKIKNVIEKNRMSLRKIDTWIDNDAFEKSYYKYGVPDYIKPYLNMEIGNEITYSDLIVYYSKYLSDISYLELGVSVGKNFFQIVENVDDSSIVGFDIENINPVLSRLFDFKKRVDWQQKEGSLRTETFTKTDYVYKTNSISYIAADIWDENSWSKLKGNRFNIIFSDALHDPKALLWEFEMIEKYELLADRFLIVWDDLNNGLENSFHAIEKKLQIKYKLKAHNSRLIKINGWLGKNEIKHDVGLITNISI